MDLPEFVVKEYEVESHAPKLDVSGVRPLDARASLRCPVRIQHDIDPPENVTPEPASELVEQLMRAGREFEAARLAELVGDGAVVLTDDLAASTIAAMESEVPVIAGGAFPIDAAGRRSGRPDILVRSLDRTASSGRPAYWPVEVKQHSVLADRGKRPAVASPPDRPFAEGAIPVEGKFETASASRKRDLFQLAHYWRMLQACGHAADESGGPVWAGVLGTDGLVVWADLAAPRFRSEGSVFRNEVESTLRCYDFEFSRQLDIAATAVARLVDLDVPLLAEPMQCSECAGCRWREACRPFLEADSGDSSVLPRVGSSQWRSFRDAGLRTVVDLAGLDRHRATLVNALPKSASLGALVAQASSLPSSTPVAQFVRGSSRVAALVDNGVATAGDLAEVEQTYIDLHGKPIGNLPNLIDLAWIAADGGNAPHRRRGVSDTSAPRADVEVDIDMECDFDGTTYLWGTLLTIRSGRRIGIRQGYRPFVSWELSPWSEFSIFNDVWAWLIRVQFAARDRDQTFRVYCWHESAEISKLRRGATLSGVPGVLAAVDMFVSNRDVWIDLKREFDRVAISARGSSLKTIARSAGFEWRDETPGGDQSMLWLGGATSGSTGSRQRLLEYNEDDLRAGVAIRDWLEANRLPSLPQ